MVVGLSSFPPKNYQQYCDQKTETTTAADAPSERDLKVLSVLDSVPTFNPLILELAFKRSKLAVPPFYLDLTDELRAKLKILIKARIRPLIVAALSDQPQRVENAIEELTKKLFTMGDGDEILPFIDALRLPPEEAVELMAAWLGITYFGHEYVLTQNELREVAAFLNSEPHTQGNFVPAHKVEIQQLIELVRDQLKSDWAKISHISHEYKRVYDGLVFHGEVREFREFLLNCEESYWELGDRLGRFEQTTLAWRDFKGSVIREASVELILDFLMLLRDLNAAIPHHPVEFDDGPFAALADDQEVAELAAGMSEG